MSQKVRSKATVRYAFDEMNRLVVREPFDSASLRSGRALTLPKQERGGATERLRLTRIFEGTVTTDRSSRLIYHVDSSAGQDGYAGPHTFSLDGSWKLTPNHDLALTLHEAGRRERQTVYLKGAIIKAEANALVFALRRSEDDELHTAQRLTLFGRWGADAKNRLTFLVEKADGSEDRLTLQGGWEVGKHHQLLYRYRQRGPASLTRAGQMLIFEGAWDITKADRLVYRLAGSPDSAFEFKASLQSPSLLAREGRIVYQVGIEVSRGTVRRERVMLFGTWKLHRDLSVSFEIPYAGGRIQAIRFEGAFSLTPRDRIAVALHNSRREGLGLTVTFTRELVPDASLFLRLRKGTEERSAIGGIQVRF
jgi:hypothetical protein